MFTVRIKWENSVPAELICSWVMISFTSTPVAITLMQFTWQLLVFGGTELKV